MLDIAAILAEMRARAEGICLTCGGQGWYVKPLRNGIQSRKCEICVGRRADVPRLIAALEIAVSALRVVPDDVDHLAQQALAAIAAALEGE